MRVHLRSSFFSETTGFFINSSHTHKIVMLESAWGSGKGSEQHEEITSSAVRMMDEQTQMKTFFDVLRGQFQSV